jgi:hypothetical protein
VLRARGHPRREPEARIDLAARGADPARHRDEPRAAGAARDVLGERLE